jgi:hypothetical protein
VTAPLGEGGPLFEEYQPLRSIDLRQAGCGRPEIILTLGETVTGHAALTHAVTDPAHLWVEEEPSGLHDVGLQIRSVEGDDTLLRFEVAPPESERLPIGMGLERSYGRERQPPERL